METDSVIHHPKERADLLALIDRGLSDEKIERLLLEQYQEEFLVTNLMREVRKLRNAQKASAGLILLIIGAVILFFSCVLALTGGLPEGSVGIFLFGFTTLGVVVVMAGLIKILG
jgi:hypothetical protein